MEKQRESDTRTRILSAAGPVFAAHGFDGATIREICSAADVNVASVGYYFGDKMGLYSELIDRIRDSREQQFPAPENSQSDPALMLLRIVRTILSRMQACDASGWESQLFMREMQSPTSVFEDIVNEFFRPMFDLLTATLQEVAGQPIPKHVLEQLALSVVGQCFYYKFGSGVVQILIPESERKESYGIDSLSRHITAVTLAATQDARVLEQRSQLRRFEKQLTETSEPQTEHGA